MKKILTLLSVLVLSIKTVTAADVVIKSTTNRDETNIGDYWIAEDFANAFRKLGKQTTVDYRGEYHRPHTPKPALSIYMRGYTKFTPPFATGTTVLYVYYPMWYGKSSAEKTTKTTLNTRLPPPENTNLDDEWQNYDLIAVASPTYADELRKNGINAIYTPQFTNPEKFYPALKEDLKTDILFVGSNWHDRTSLRYALESGFTVSVYGYNWKGIVPDTMYKAPYITNDKLNEYYSSAKIVLNDHRPDMKQFGFVNNRVYDATASGALVISDYMPEIKQAYGNTIPMYKTKEELAELLAYYLTHEEERQQKAAAARDITLQNFTHTAVAKKILQQHLKIPPSYQKNN